MLSAGRLRDTALGGDLTSLLRLFTIVGDAIARLAMLVVALACLMWLRRGRAALWLAAMMAGGTLLNITLKQIFAMPRPRLLPHLDAVATYSFPSGHAAGNMMFFGALAL